MSKPVKLTSNHYLGIRMLILLALDSLVITLNYTRSLCMGNTDKQKTVFSKDGDFYNHESLEDLIAEEGLSVGDTYYSSRAILIDPKGYYNVTNFINDIDESIYQDGMSDVNDRFIDVSDEAKDELKGLIDGWFDKHVSINCWEVVGEPVIDRIHRY